MSVFCEACSKPIDPDSPDVERGGHLICLDCQSDILASSLAWVNNRREVVYDRAIEQAAQAEWLRQHMESKGEPIPDGLREMSEYYRRERAREAEQDARLWPWQKDGSGLEKWVLYGLVIQLAGIILFHLRYSAVVVLLWFGLLSHSS